MHPSPWIPAFLHRHWYTYRTSKESFLIIQSRNTTLVKMNGRSIYIHLWNNLPIVFDSELCSWSWFPALSTRKRRWSSLPKLMDLQTVKITHSIPWLHPAMIILNNSNMFNEDDNCTCSSNSDLSNFLPNHPVPKWTKAGHCHRRHPPVCPNCTYISYLHSKK